jgi:hypothetical protein
MAKIIKRIGKSATRFYKGITSTPDHYIIEDGLRFYIYPRIRPLNKEKASLMASKFRKLGYKVEIKKELSSDRTVDWGYALWTHPKVSKADNTKAKKL